MRQGQMEHQTVSIRKSRDGFSLSDHAERHATMPSTRTNVAHDGQYSRRPILIGTIGPEGGQVQRHVKGAKER